MGQPVTNVYEAAQCRVTLLDERMTTDIITVIDSQRPKVRSLLLGLLSSIWCRVEHGRAAAVTHIG